MSAFVKIRTLFKQLDGFSDDAVVAAIERARHYVNTAQWGSADRADYGRALLAAHFLTAPTGPAVKVRSGGGISETYAVGDEKPCFSTTAYGTEYLELLGRCVPQRFSIASVSHATILPGFFFGRWGSGGY